MPKLQSYKLKILVPVLYGIAGIGLCLYVMYHQNPTVWQYAGFILTLASFILWIIARIQLASNFSIGAKANHLVTSGLYAKFSHPVYLFSITALIGMALVLQSGIILALCAVLVVLEILRARSEEQVLRKKFGNQYDAYKKTVWL